jgi:hypothetical protein
LILGRQPLDDVEVNPGGSLSSAESCYGRIKDWLTSCSSSHTLCAKKSSFIPPRLIHVGSDGQKDPYLVDTSASDFPESSRSRRYVALSYCWGKAGNFTTTSATLKERKQRIPFEGVSEDGDSLPQSIKDAIAITRRLGWRYLWVDALCIIQGSNEEAIADWQNQSGMMGEIYGNASVTIAAARASDVHGGICHERYSIDPVVVRDDGHVVRRIGQTTSIPRGPSVPAERVYLSTPPIFVPVARGSIFDEPLCKRAWALQERILSRRVITYGTDEITWQCRTCVETETGSPSPETTRSLNYFEPNTLGFIWPRIVTQYSHFATTRSTDKLPALSGLVRTIQSEHKCTYIAGLWESTFSNDLLWRADSPRSLAKPAQYRAPSWSWAWLDENINNIPRDGADLAQLVRCRITVAGLDPAGEVSDGYISIRGPFGLFPRLGAAELVSEPTQKLDIFDSRGIVIGGAFLDTADFPELPWIQPNLFVRIRRRTEKFGLQTKPNAGMILIRVSEKEEVYSRVGMFMLNAVGKSWFSQMEKKKIKII